MDAGVRRLLVRAGHDCWTVWEAGLAGPVSAQDDDVSVYADNRQAILITHDRELFQRRRERTFGIHVRLRCEQPDAVNLVRDKLEEIEAAIDAGHALIEVAWEQVRTFPSAWD